MSIVLSWTKKDTDAVLQGYEIYRSTSKATVFDAANKLASSTDKSLVTYTDNAAASDVPYWYGIRSLTIYGNVDSTPVLLVDPTIVGAGTALPFIGDFEDGFIESYPSEQSFTAAATKIILDQIQKALPAAGYDMTLSPATSANAQSYQVNKFWKNGKVIFAPNHPQGGITGNILVSDLNTKVVAALMAAKPKVEIDGVMYEFNIMTRDEVVKYLASGQTYHQANVTNHYTERAVPKSFYYTYPNGVGIRVTCRDGGDNVLGLQLETSGLFTNYTNSANIGNWPSGIAWYFTPVIG